ncbi:NBS-LRR type resistance protein [Cucumis melo var. makuwa]|uniref:NBS-LRR type resistance protein n=1 Tax=Cucumis melo var. makuwa TaxID=1194695 RepID=A0A5A7UIZ5_CUCMM|nr:NBS-LRR type resistance protein [Cucumis melo var. makuwa]
MPSWWVGKDCFPDASPNALLMPSGKPLFPTFFMPTCFSASGMLHFLVVVVSHSLKMRYAIRCWVDDQATQKALVGDPSRRPAERRVQAVR